MTALSYHLDRLFRWLESIGLQPPSRDVRIVEINQSDYNIGDDTHHIHHDQLRKPSEYEGRFDELLAAGYSWINLSCCGVHNGLLVVTIELPSLDEDDEDSLRPGWNTSVNLSGPRRDVLLDHRCSVDPVLTIR
jgi:hypothetical protein